MVLRPVIVIAGIGNGSGTGGATARRFAKAGWSVALISRDRGDGSLTKLSESITESGGEATPFALSDYGPTSFAHTFNSIKQKYDAASGYTIRAAVYNASQGTFKPFLEHSTEDFENTIKTNIGGAWYFARESILAIKDNEKVSAKELDSGSGDHGGRVGVGKKGTIIFTGATASTRGNVLTSAFSSGKHGVRALSQSLAKEFGKQGIHVAHAIIDGGIKTGQRLEKLPAEQREGYVGLEPEAIAEAYYGLVQQHQSACTWELDLRSLDEKW